MKLDVYLNLHLAIIEIKIKLTSHFFIFKHFDCVKFRIENRLIRDGALLVSIM